MGIFINGERILIESSYLEAEFKTILLKLLSYVKTRRKALEPKQKLSRQNLVLQLKLKRHYFRISFQFENVRSLSLSPTNIRCARENVQRKTRQS